MKKIDDDGVFIPMGGKPIYEATRDELYMPLMDEAAGKRFPGDSLLIALASLGSGRSDRAKNARVYFHENKYVIVFEMEYTIDVDAIDANTETSQGQSQ